MSKRIDHETEIGNDIFKVVSKLNNEKELHTMFGTGKIHDLFFTEEDPRDPTSLDYWTDRWADWLSILGPWLSEEEDE